MRRCYMLIAVALLPLACSGCAVFDKDNTPLLNWTEEHVVPESEDLQTVVAPFTFTLGLVAVTTDMLIVNPVLSIDDAAEDSVHILWQDTEWDEHYVTECAFLPIRTVLTPPVYAGAFVIRSFITGPETE